MEYEIARAYGLGYYHGRVFGAEQNPFDSDLEIIWYQRGYCEGVTAYCEEDENEIGVN